MESHQNAVIINAILLGVGHLVQKEVQRDMSKYLKNLIYIGVVRSSMSYTFEPAMLAELRPSVPI